MHIINLNVGSDLLKILNGSDSGKERQYIDLGQESKTQNDLIISLAGSLNKSGVEFVGIESKYLFGKRNKRLEIVYKDKSKVHIIKISKQTKFDKDALELDILITDIIINQNTDVIGIILLIDDFETATVNEYAKSMKNTITFLSYNKFKEICHI